MSFTHIVRYMHVRCANVFQRITRYMLLYTSWISREQFNRLNYNYGYASCLLICDTFLANSIINIRVVSIRRQNKTFTRFDSNGYPSVNIGYSREIKYTYSKILLFSTLFRCCTVTEHVVVMMTSNTHCNLIISFFRFRHSLITKTDIFQTTPMTQSIIIVQIKNKSHNDWMSVFHYKVDKKISFHFYAACISGMKRSR